MELSNFFFSPQKDKVKNIIGEQRGFLPSDSPQAALKLSSKEFNLLESVDPEVESTFAAL